MNKIQESVTKGLVIAVASLGSFVITAEASINNRESNSTQKAANRITRLISERRPIPINGNYQLIWSKPNSRYTYQYSTDIEVQEKINHKKHFFKLDVIKDSIVAEPIPESDVRVQLESPLIYEPIHKLGQECLRVLTSDAVISLVNHKPEAVVMLNNGRSVHTEVGETRRIDTNVITAYAG